MGRDWNSIMFDNIGEKIKKVAKVTAWIGIVVSIIGGIVLFFWGLIELEYLWFLIFLAPITVVVGCIMAWLSVIMLYGFGELIEKARDIEKNTRKSDENVKENKAQISKQSNSNDKFNSILTGKNTASTTTSKTIIGMGSQHTGKCEVCGQETLVRECTVDEQ